MAEIVKKSVTTQQVGPKAAVTTEVKTVATPNQTFEYLVYFLFGVLEVLLAFRFVFKLAGANPGSPFVSLIYGITRIFIFPFEGIFRRGTAQGIETTSVLEPSTIVAMFVYAILLWGIIKLVRIFSGERQAE